MIKYMRAEYLESEEKNHNIYLTNGKRHLCIAGGLDNTFIAVMLEVWGVS